MRISIRNSRRTEILIKHNWRCNLWQYFLHALHTKYVVAKINNTVDPVNNWIYVCQEIKTRKFFCIKFTDQRVWLKYTYMSAILLLGIRTASTRIFGCGKTNAHIGDTEYVSYCDVFQNLMYLSSKKHKKTQTLIHVLSNQSHASCQQWSTMWTAAKF